MALGPTDCWRFYPDGFRALAKYSESELLEVSTDWLPSEDTDSSQWGDTVGVFRKVVPHSNLLRVQDRHRMETRATEWSNSYDSSTSPRLGESVGQCSHLSELHGRYEPDCERGDTEHSSHSRAVNGLSGSEESCLPTPLVLIQ